MKTRPRIETLKSTKVCNRLALPLAALHGLPLLLMKLADSYNWRLM